MLRQRTTQRLSQWQQHLAEGLPFDRFPVRRNAEPSQLQKVWGSKGGAKDDMQ